MLRVSELFFFFSLYVFAFFGVWNLKEHYFSSLFFVSFFSFFFLILLFPSYFYFIFVCTFLIFFVEFAYMLFAFSFSLAQYREL